ncbi:flagellar basal body P-ring protein FlgI [Halanaerobacter jeridensis]|uniref:Flagellar P-ring protein n=1 Tax=Halanaerobacter jeridensis TaxID=706427 RepID=A0A938XWM5_9FIRM|nr:flagellar basal body P-ring protein FlgI [Halanaerobacter jeridensis]MBM7556997.1 flagellar P-ring protein precursor FlgI [Halanaerobacter jeridensis]
MKKLIKTIVMIVLVVMFSNTALALTPSQSTSNDPLVRVKDITRVKGVRSNQLIGYGIVVGLAGTGDGAGNEFTIRSVSNMLQKFGVDVEPQNMSLDNVAAVMVTAKLPPFAQSGDKIDVTLSSLGNADTLQGGTLLMTPLEGPSGDRVYAVAQGPVSIGGFNAGQGGNEVRQNHPTVGRIPNGALIERTVPNQFSNHNRVSLVLNEPNFTTAENIAKVINSHFGYSPEGDKYAKAIDAGQVEVKVPDHYDKRKVEFVSRLGKLNVRPDTKAKVVINERTGTIVMGHNVRLSKVSVSHGNLTVTIATENEVVQPNQQGEENNQQPQQVQNQDVNVEEEQDRLAVLPKGSNISDVVKALNKVGAKPRDIISILQSIKQSGALHADLEIM